MQSNNRPWFKLFLFCAGLTLAAGFICQWLGGDFWLNNDKFTILELELFYSKREVINAMTQLQQPLYVSSNLALHYQLIFDFAFMAGIYPCIACLCMMVRNKINKKGLKDILFALAILQPVAWAFDVVENSYLLDWMQHPDIGDEFATYHRIVIFKWVIALAGVFVSLLMLIFRKKTIDNRP